MNNSTNRRPNQSSGNDLNIGMLAWKVFRLAWRTWLWLIGVVLAAVLYPDILIVTIMLGPVIMVASIWVRPVRRWAPIIGDVRAHRRRGPFPALLPKDLSGDSLRWARRIRRSWRKDAVAAGLDRLVAGTRPDAWGKIHNVVPTVVAVEAVPEGVALEIRPVPGPQTQGDLLKSAPRLASRWGIKVAASAVGDVDVRVVVQFQDPLAGTRTVVPIQRTGW